MSRKSFLPWAFTGYLVFVVYGSLVPFEFRPLSLSEGWEQFTHLRYLNLGVQSRADWIANLVLYIPLTFLGMAWAHRRIASHAASLSRIVAVMMFAVCVAVAVEFVQVFVKPRTVSLNDLIAEIIGSGFGIALWYASRVHLTRGLASLAADPKTAVAGALGFYLIAYLVLSLFPYDFVLSSSELSWKLETDRVALFMAAGSCPQSLRCLAKLVAEALVVVPVGVLIGLRHGGERLSLSHAFFYGGLLGLVIEATQLFMASGVSQGVSVLTRGIGVMAGVALYRWQRNDGLSSLTPLLGPLLVLGTVPYLLLLMALNGWFASPWAGLEETLMEVEGKHFIPFYYHYFSSEASAMDSLLANAGMYAPIGLAYWALTAGRWNSASALVPGIVAAVVALVIEGGKLFVVGKHADPTNMLIAGAAAALAYHTAAWLAGRKPMLVPSKTAQPENEIAKRTTAAHRRDVSRHPLVWLLSLIISVCVVAVLWRYPVGAIPLSALLIGYAILLWQRHTLWLFVVPALLPVLDFATWTGWFYLTEFDLLLMVTLAVLLVRSTGRAEDWRLPRGTALLIAAFGVAYGISLLRGLLPLQPIDENSFAGYYSHYNALRLGKGVLWAFLLLPFLGRALREGDTMRRYLVPGMLAGLAMTSVLIVYERWAFPGVFNLSSSYRATAFFSSMHVGGASVDAYLALSLPFAALCFLLWRSRWSYGIGLTLYLLGLHAFLVTFSRINYLALGVATLVIIAGLARDRSLGHRYFVIALPLVVITAIVSVPLLLSPYTTERFASLEADMTTRQHHWQQAVALTDRDPMTRLFGMGVGSFPRVYFWADPGPSRPASYAYLHEQGDGFLRLGSGRPLYILQRIRPPASGQVDLNLSLRGAQSARGLTAMICEKPLLYSRRCESASFELAREDRGWQARNASLRLDAYGKAGRSVYLVLYNPHVGTVVEVDGVSVRESDGRELIANGGFARGSDHWFFTSDDHKSWRMDNLWIHLLFEQGWLGVVTLALLLIITLARLARAAWHGDSISLVLSASLLAGLTVGLVDSIVEAPRLTLLFLAVLFVSLYHVEARLPGMAAARGPGRARTAVAAADQAPPGT